MAPKTFVPRVLSRWQLSPFYSQVCRALSCRPYSLLTRPRPPTKPCAHATLLLYFPFSFSPAPRRMNACMTIACGWQPRLRGARGVPGVGLQRWRRACPPGRQTLAICNLAKSCRYSRNKDLCFKTWNFIFASLFTSATRQVDSWIIKTRKPTPPTSCYYYFFYTFWSAASFAGRARSEPVDLGSTRLINLFKRLACR